MLFGRDKFIDNIWGILDESSILLTAERRMGKTVVLKQMRDNPRDDYIVIFSDLEKISKPVEFLEDILQKAWNHQSMKGKAKQYASILRGLVDGVEIPKVLKIPNSQEIKWKTLLKEVISDICIHNKDKKILFLWDEMPYMLDNIKNHDPKQNVSLEILDVLRALRQEHSNLRMIYTGSIGMHHVLLRVKINSPIQSINDLSILRLPPIAELDAIEMARYRFVTKEGIDDSVEDELLIKIVQFCDNVPYYIDKVIGKLALSSIKLSLENIDSKLQEILMTYGSDLNLEHFRARLKDYYAGVILDVQGKEISLSHLAKQILNYIAVNNKVTIEECFSDLRSKYALSVEHRDKVVELLKLLTDDHYFVKNGQHYEFAFSMIKRWWVEAEGLEEEMNNGK